MKRREFIGFLGGAATWPFVARAQQPAMPVIGLLAAGGPPPSFQIAAVNKGLAETGFVEGRNVSMVIRVAQQYDRLPAVVAEFVRLPVAVILTSGSTEAPLAAKAATTTIPIVFAMGEDPVRAGLVPSLNRPGGNMTGVIYFSATLTAKRLELLRELVPQPALVALVVNPGTERAERDVGDLETAARAIGQNIMVARAATPSELDTAFAKIASSGAGAVLIGGDAFLNRSPDQIAALAARYRIPTSYPSRAGPDAGGLMSYGDDRAESHRQAGIYVGRVLKGEKPADIPVLQPAKFELVINLKTAKTLGLDVPQSVLARADEVIE